MSELKHGLLFGNSYPSHEANQVVSCSKAAIRMTDCLVEHLNFKRENVQLRLDIDPMLNKGWDLMEDVMTDFVTARKEGQTALIFVAGHGTLGYSLLPDEKIRVENSFLTSDNKQLRDTSFKKVVDRVPYGVSLTLVCDFCFSGGILGGLNRIFKDPLPAKIQFLYDNDGRPSSADSSYVQKIEVKKEAPLKPVIFIHTSHKYEPAYGWFGRTSGGLEQIAKGTHFLIDTIERKSGNVGHMDLVENIRDCCKNTSYKGQIVQHPGLSCSDDERYKYFLGGNGDAAKGWKQDPTSEFLQKKMMEVKLSKISAIVRTGGKSTMRRKKKSSRRSSRNVRG